MEEVHRRIAQVVGELALAIVQKADRWDAMQCPARFADQAPAFQLFGDTA